MKLLHIIPSLDPEGGGPVEGLKRIAAEMERLGNQVEIATLDSPNSGFSHGVPFVVHRLGPARFNYRYSTRFIPWLRENADRYNAVVVEGLWQFHGFGAWRVLRTAGVPYFIFPHGMLSPWFRKNYPFKHLKKWIYWLCAEYRVLRDARAVVFTCEEERRSARESFWLYRAKESVSGYGTAAPPVAGSEVRLRFRAANPELLGKRVVFFMGRLHEVKGCDLLLEAFSRVAAHDERLHLVMAGPDQAGWAGVLKDRADALGISRRVSWPGMISGDDKWGAYHASEVFCLPSHHENFGIVVAEALACGKPVLISNKVNIWREIEADGAGFVDDDSVEGTVRNLNRWLALDQNARVEMAERARQCFANRFHIHRAAERLLEIIQEHTR